MRHCAPDELIDVIEGLRDERSLPHLGACASCRDELRTAREALAAVQAVPAPEPPPFAMEQLSARVRTALAAETTPRRAGGWRVAPLGAFAALAAAVLLAVVLWPSQAPAPAQMSRDAAASPPTVPLAPAGPAVVAAVGPDDPSIVWMMELADGLADRLNDDSWALADGLSIGATDGAVDALSADELQELARLIREAMGSSGA